MLAGWLVMVNLGHAESPTCDALAAEVAALDASDGHLSAALGALRAQSIALGLERCAQQALRARNLPAGVRPAEHPLPPPPDGIKTTRDIYDVPNARESENFVLRWGSSVRPADAELMLDAFEVSWQVEVGEMGYPAPLYSDSIKFNVYIGDTGNGAPSSLGAAGYFSFDEAGYPLIVMSPLTMEYITGYGDAVAAHEFFHAVQNATGSSYVYANGFPGAWFYEATASWIMNEVFPDDSSYAGFLFGFSTLPHLSLDFFRYPEVGATEEYYQYGAFIFIRYLSEIAADREIIRTAWLESPESGDPLVRIAEALEREYNTTLFDAYSDFAARNLLWDYEDGELYGAYHDGFIQQNSGRDVRISQDIRDNTDGWVASGDTPPQRLGTNYLNLISPAPSILQVQFEGEPTGTEGSPAVWSVWFVTRSGERVPLTVEDGAVDFTSEADDSGWLVINVDSSIRFPGETFAYRFAVNWEAQDTPDTGTPDDVDDDNDDDSVDGGSNGGRSGCATTPGSTSFGGLGWGLAMLLIVGGRRREV